MPRNLWKTASILLLALIVALPARPQGVEHTQLQAVKDLASKIFGDNTVAEPVNPCQASPPCGCPAPPNDGACKCDQLFSGSPNQKLLARTWYYGWALRNGTAADISCARTQLQSHLTNQEAFGHYSISTSTDEALTSSHFQLWAAGMAGAYLIAETSGKAWTFTPRTTDTSVLTPVNRWWLDEKKLWDTLATTTGTAGVVDAPGARFPTTDNPPSTNLVYRNLVYKELQRNWPQSTPPQWATDQYYTGGWILDKMIQLNPTVNVVAPISGYTPIVRLHETLCLYRQGTEWLEYFPLLRSADDPVFWVQNRSGQPHALASVGGRPVNPPVKPANSSTAMTLTQINGLVSGFATCPPSTAF
jgi:hypothetical protein